MKICNSLLFSYFQIVFGIKEGLDQIYPVCVFVLRDVWINFALSKKVCAFESPSKQKGCFIH